MSDRIRIESIFHTTTYSMSEIKQGVAVVYSLDDEYLAGAQRQMRLRVLDLFKRGKRLLETACPDETGQLLSWAHDWMKDSDTHSKYEYLDDLVACENDLVDLGTILGDLHELIYEFDPDFSEESFDPYMSDDSQRTLDEGRVFCHNDELRARLHAERAALLAEIADCKRRLDIRH